MATINRNYQYKGDPTGHAQSVVVIPAKAEANKPGVLSIQSVSGTTTSDRFLWFTSAGVPRYDGTFPTTPDSDGTALGGATTTLSNLASVAIPDVGDLLPLNANQVSVGNATKYMSDVFIGGSLYHQTATFDVRLTFATPAADRAYAFPDAGGDGDVMVNVGGANAITLTNGTADVTLGAAGSLGLGAAAALDIGASGNVDFGTGTYNFVGNIDVATGKAVDIDANVTIGATAALTTSGASAITLDQDLQQSASVTFGDVTTSGIINTTTVADFTVAGTGVALSIGANTNKLSLGTQDATDSYLAFNGTSLTFYDSQVGAALTLQQLYQGTTLNPIVTGDLTIPDGKFNWTDSAQETAGSWSFSNTGNDSDIDIVSSGDTGEVIDIIANSITTGKILKITADAMANGTHLYLDSDGGVGATGYYLYGTDGTNADITIGDAGATQIFGAAHGTAALTVTAGDLKLTDGFLNLDATAGNYGHNIATADDGTSNTAFITLTNSNVAFDQALLLVDANATGAIDGVQITHDSTGYGLSVVGTAATGKQALFQGPASQTTSSVVIDGTTAPSAWIGAAGVGMLHLKSDGALADTTASLIYATYTGNAAGANQYGTAAYLLDAGAASGTSYAVFVDSTNNNGLWAHASATGKKALYVNGVQGQTATIAHIDGTTGTGWVGADTAGVLKIAASGNLAHANASVLQIACSGQAANSALGSCIRSLDSGTASGAQPAYANYFSSTNNDVAAFITGSVGVANITANAFTNQTESMVILDGTTADWIGAAGNGMIEIHSDGTFADADAHAIRVTKTGATVAAMTGSLLHLTDASTGGATGGYVAYINASGALEALHVDAGVVLVDETVTASGGLVTQVDVGNRSAPPLDAEMDTGLGTPTAGRICVYDDAGAGSSVYLIVGDGTDWHYVLTTQCA